jgi:hypothetical protein
MTPQNSKIIICCSIIVLIVLVIAIILIVLFTTHSTSSPSSSSSSSSLYGCNPMTGQCEVGKGTQSKEECTCEKQTYACNQETGSCEDTQKLTNTSLSDCTCSQAQTYGCNPLTGHCEVGKGTQSKEECTCEKQTYACNQDTWTCQDTQKVTNTSKSNCDCTPKFKVSYYNLNESPPQSCTQDSDCPQNTEHDFTWTCQDGYCDSSTPINCQNTNSHTSSIPSIAEECMTLFYTDIPGLSPNKLCSQITDAKECQQTSYESKCTDQTNKVWGTYTNSCFPFDKP